MIAVGLMSGTSLDGVDAARVSVVPSGEVYAIELLDFVTQPFGDDLEARLRSVLPPNGGSLELMATLHRDVGRALARAARAVAGDARIDYVASHGQTMWHDGERNITLQIGDPFVIREAMHATVCYDFRSADTAAGGFGAPLVPSVDAMLLADPDEARVALNLGGIANVSVLPREMRRDGKSGYDVLAFDTGPGNMLIDAFVRERSRAALRFDRDGALAARGAVNAELLGDMLADPYFRQKPPKTTGRERFGVQFLARYEGRFRTLSTEDGAATLTELTAASVADAVGTYAPETVRVVVSGGGARNATLQMRLRARLTPVHVETSNAMGIDADAKEAIAFAILGYETLRGRSSNVPRATGATRAVSLGGVAPYQLAELLARLESECAG